MNVQKVLGVIGLVAYLVVGMFPYLPSGLMVPLVGLWGLWVAWLFGAVLTWRTFRSRPAWTLVSAPAALVFWFVYVSIGERLFGWTA
jgi:hypothetical protein